MVYITIEQDKASKIRAQRDQMIINSKWLDERLADEVLLGLTPTMTSEQIATYRQALRDVTLQPTFPDSVVWPEL